MPTLTFSISRSGWDSWHGSASIAYTLSYDAAANRTTVTFQPSSLSYPGRKGYHTHCDTTLTVRAGDDPSSSGTAALHTEGTSDTAGAVYTGTPSPSVTVQHSAGPGAKTVSVDAALSLFVYPFSNSASMYEVTGGGSRTDTSHTIPSASAIASCPTAAKTNDAIRVSMTRCDRSYRHVASFRAGGTTLDTSASFDTQLTYTIPRSWFSSSPNTATLNVTVFVQTYTGGGAAVGSPATASLTVTADAGMKPTIGSGFASAAACNTGTAAAAVAGFVQGFSRARLTLTRSAVSCPYGATVASYKLTCLGASTTKTGPGASETLTTGTLTAAGETTLTVTVTDSRGRSASAALPVTVMPYAPPTLSGVSVFRCGAGGTADEDGRYCSVKASEAHASLNGQNGVTLTARLKESGGSYGSPAALTSGAASVLGGGLVDPDKSCLVRVTATDSLGGEATATVTLPTRQWALKLQSFPGGLGAAFGKAPEHAKALELPADWELWRGAVKTAAYRPGDTAAFTTSFLLAGLVTSDARQIVLDAVLPGPMLGVASVSALSLKGNLRGVKGYLENNSNPDWTLGGYTTAVTILSQDRLRFTIQKSTAFVNASDGTTAVNNTPLSFWGTFSLSFS